MIFNELRHLRRMQREEALACGTGNNQRARHRPFGSDLERDLRSGAEIAKPTRVDRAAGIRGKYRVITAIARVAEGDGAWFTIIVCGGEEQDWTPCERAVRNPPSVGTEVDNQGLVEAHRHWLQRPAGLIRHRGSP